MTSPRGSAQRQLSLYGDQLEWASQLLAQTIERFEAVAEIARAVGGDTDLQHVLSVIIAHGQETLGAELVVFLPDGDELAAVGGTDPTFRLRSSALSPATCCALDIRAAFAARSIR